MPIRSDLWHAWTDDTPDAFIVAEFVRRYGQTPERIVREKGLALAGPVPDDDAAQDRPESAP
jgi:hypothetical protein